MNVSQELMYSIRPCLRQLDHYEYIKEMNIFDMPMLKPTRESRIY